MQHNDTTSRPSLFAALTAAPRAIASTVATTAIVAEEIIDDIASNRNAITESVRDLGRVVDFGVISVAYGVRSGISESLEREVTDEEWTTSQGRRSLAKELFRYKPEVKELPGKETPKVEEPKVEGLPKVKLTNDLMQANITF